MGIRENIQHVQSRIAAALTRAGRSPDSVTLIAVTKTVDIPQIQEALQAGIIHIGENRIQDAAPKIEALREKTGITWHMIGHLQTNKVKRAVELFDLIHAVDSLRLAEEIHKRAIQQGNVKKVLFEVNVSGEESKFGLAPEEVLPILREASQLEGIVLKGLMTMAPFLAEPEETRPYFRKLHELFTMLREHNIGQMEELSMGMTNDFEIAIEEGATMVRVGTAIFGER